MRVLGNDFTVGADPEVFVENRGMNISAHGLIQGDKANPLPVDKGAVQVDGMALEFNIDPAKNQREFLKNLRAVKGQLQDMVGDRGKLAIKPVSYFSEKVMEETPAEALILGCEPDFNAWEDGRPNPTPRPPKPNMRTAGGHIHIGGFPTKDPFGAEHMSNCIHLTKFLDNYLYIPSLLWDKNHTRREVYGMYGAFRPKEYGVEYRSLSNAWLKDEELQKFVFKAVRIALTNAFRRDRPAYTDRPLFFITQRHNKKNRVPAVKELFGCLPKELAPYVEE